MKNIFVALLATVSMQMQAQGLTVTLQKANDVVLFKGVDAFKQAYEAADSGNVILMSVGKFNTIEKVEKPITIKGTGAFESVNNTMMSGFAIASNKVIVEGIYFSGDVSLDSVTDCRIRKCRIEGELSAGGEHSNTVVDQSFVSKESANVKGLNYCIKNSVIMSFTGASGAMHVAYITNCTLRNLTNFPCAIYKNNIMTCSSTLYSPREFYYNIFSSTMTYGDGVRYAGNTVASVSFTNSDYFYPANPGYGQDGTLRGPQGGSGFSKYPSLPRVVTQKIATSTDANGNLDVSLKVQAVE